MTKNWEVGWWCSKRKISEARICEYVCWQNVIAHSTHQGYQTSLAACKLLFQSPHSPIKHGEFQLFASRRFEKINIRSILGKDFPFLPPPQQKSEFNHPTSILHPYKSNHLLRMVSWNPNITRFGDLTHTSSENVLGFSEDAWEKNIKHILPHGGLFHGDFPCYKLKKSPEKTRAVLQSPRSWGT